MLSVPDCACVEAGEEDVRATSAVEAGAHRAVAGTSPHRGGRRVAAGCGRGGVPDPGGVEHGARLRSRVPADELGVDGLRDLLDSYLSGDDGGVGESFTREVLDGREFGWPVVDDVPMEHRNIDHVAVSPRAVLAIETKFVGAGRQWARDPHRNAAMDGARSSARSVRSILRSQGITDMPVEPVLMLWGPVRPSSRATGPSWMESTWCEAYRPRTSGGVCAAAVTSARVERRPSSACSGVIRPCVTPTAGRADSAPRGMTRGSQHD